MEAVCGSGAAERRVPVAMPTSRYLRANGPIPLSELPDDPPRGRWVRHPTRTSRWLSCEQIAKLPQGVKFSLKRETAECAYLLITQLKIGRAAGV
jgi:hypothetical protein